MQRKGLCEDKVCHESAFYKHTRTLTVKYIILHGYLQYSQVQYWQRLYNLFHENLRQARTRAHKHKLSSRQQGAD